MNYQHQQQHISGNTGGTPITQLRKDLVKNDLESNYSFDSIKTSTDIRQLVDEINNKDINLNNDVKSVYSNKSEKDTLTDIDTDTITNTNTDTDTDTDTYSNKLRDSKKRKTKKTNKTNFIYDTIFDGVILFVIFILMSQGFVKNFIGKHIKIINVNEEGYVPFTGVTAYGVIFVLVFLSARVLVKTIQATGKFK
jgi:hypothetical protein